VTESPPPLSGRRSEAARNDSRILEAAREVFLRDSSAPIADVAAHAGVGISALYRRYPSKEVLLRELARDGLTRYLADLEIALADDSDPWTVYCACLARVVDGQSQALAQRLAGTFTTTSELSALAVAAGEKAQELHDRTQRAGALRMDLTSADVVLVVEMVMAVTVGADGGRGLRHRYLALVLEAMHAPGAGELPGAAPAGGELAARWRRGGTADS
jgi:AcrR family transcriptional regulator